MVCWHGENTSVVLILFSCMLAWHKVCLCAVWWPFALIDQACLVRCNTKSSSIPPCNALSFSPWHVSFLSRPWLVCCCLYSTAWWERWTDLDVKYSSACCLVYSVLFVFVTLEAEYFFPRYFVQAWCYVVDTIALQYNWDHQVWCS